MKLPTIDDHRNIGFLDFIEGKAACEHCANWKALKPWERDEWIKLEGETSALNGMGKPGFCLLHPPRPHQGQEGTLRKAVWPLTEARQQCGGFIGKNYEERHFERMKNLTPRRF